MRSLTSSLLRIKLALLLQFWLAYNKHSFVQSYPIGAGYCPKGMAAIDSNFSPHRENVDQSGSIEEGGFVVQIDGVTIQDSGAANLSVDAGEHIVTVSANSTTATDTIFRGILIRMEGDSTVVDVIPGDDLAICGFCNKGVGSANHVNSNPKSTASATFVTDTESTTADQIQLDITLVVSVVHPSPNVWYYSGYSLDVAAPGPTSGASAHMYVWLSLVIEATLVAVLFFPKLSW